MNVEAEEEFHVYRVFQYKCAQFAETIAELICTKEIYMARSVVEPASV